MVKVTVTSSVSAVTGALISRIPTTLRSLEQAVIRSCEPFVPYWSGELCRSATACGNDTEGKVVYTAGHASMCYYATRKFSQKRHPNACARWFEAAKMADLSKWVDAAASSMIGGKQSR